MRKNILIVGGEELTRFEYKKGNVLINNNEYLKKLAGNDIDNLSNAKLSSNKALRLINVFINARRYDECIISLGYADLIDGVDPYTFERNLSNIIKLLEDNNINYTVLNNVQPKVYNAERYSNIIDNISKNRSSNEIKATLSFA